MGTVEVASNPGRDVLERKRKALEKKNGEPYRVIVASNGEAAILPVRVLEEVNKP